MFTVSPISGWIYFANYDELRTNKNDLRLPTTIDEIEKISRAFFNQCYQRIEKARLNGKLPKDFPDILPSDIRLVDMQAVFAPTLTSVDHWLVRFHIYHRSSDEFGSDSVCLYGAGLDLRVGNGGKVICFSQRWRPFQKTVVSDFIPFNQEEVVSSHEHESSPTNANEPTLMYLQAGQSSFQSHLSLYHTVADGHHLEFYPASKHSLRIEFIKNLKEEHIEVVAEISGGSGRFSFEWGSWEVANAGGNGYKDLGNYNSCIVHGGVHQLLLIVRDIELMVVSQKIEAIYAKYPTSAPKSRERWGCTDALALNYDSNANCDDESCVYESV